MKKSTRQSTSNRNRKVIKYSSGESEEDKATQFVLNDKQSKSKQPATKTNHRNQQKIKAGKVADDDFDFDPKETNQIEDESDSGSVSKYDDESEQSEDSNFMFRDSKIKQKIKTKKQKAKILQSKKISKKDSKLQIDNLTADFKPLAKKRAQPQTQKQVQQQQPKQNMQFINNENIKNNDSSEEDTDEILLPVFIREENIKDNKLRRPGHPDYDATTVHISEQEFKKLTATQKQYWSVKKIHYDKIVIIKIWKFHHAYNEDAIIIAKLMDYKLKNPKGKSPFIFFHESSLPKVEKVLLENGKKVVVVEQMDDFRGEDQDIITREVCQVITAGTYVSFNPDEKYSSRFLLSFTMLTEQNNQNHFGFTLLDATTHEVYIGEFEDDMHYTQFRTLCQRASPVEFVYSRSFVSAEIESIIRNLPWKPQVTLIKDFAFMPLLDIYDSALREYFDFERSLEEIDFDWKAGKQERSLQMKQEQNIHFSDDHIETTSINDKQEKQTKPMPVPQLLKEIRRAQDEFFSNSDNEGVKQQYKIPFFLSLQSLMVALFHLKNTFLDEICIKFGNFNVYDLHFEEHNFMHLDAQAFQNLELVQTNITSKALKQYSLLEYMDHTRTQFGKRKFQRWLETPLMDIAQIKARQDAIQDLMANIDIVGFFQDQLFKLSDLERKIYRISNISKRRMEAAYFEHDYVYNRLKEFIAYLQEMKKIEDLIETFDNYSQFFTSQKLLELVTFQDNQLPRGANKQTIKGMFPRLNEIIKEIEEQIVYHDKMPLPAHGIDPEYDLLIEQIQQIKQENLQVYLLEQQKRLKCQQIKYVNVKERYEIEIPEKFVEGSKRPEEYQLTSKKKGFDRFHTDYIKTQVYQLYMLEYQCKNRVKPFIIDFFRRFMEKKQFWLQMTSCLAELDCLCSLAKLGLKMQNEKYCCRPNLEQNSKFELINSVHPCVQQSQQNGVKFVANSVLISAEQPVILVTGPNMGGKSTLLRQACINVIMAQMGSLCPAERFTLSPVDRIFTRIGASDRILEGKSTFYVELEETAQILHHATPRSFCIVDELGRGTSTFDGMAIASAVLKYLIKRKHCRTLFSTHYHILSSDFMLYNEVRHFHMGYQLLNANVEFTHQFLEGHQAHSLGLNVAKMAKIPQSVIEVAEEQAEMMNTQMMITKQESISNNFGKIIMALFANHDSKSQISEENHFQNDNAIRLLNSLTI